MPVTDDRVDTYIARAAEFAQPVLRAWRAQVHQTCPEVVEALKWSHPFFTYNGKMLSHMAAFKAHCAIGFWHGEAAAQTGKQGEAMGQFGRITGFADLPSASEQSAMIQRAMALIDADVKPAWRVERAATAKQRPAPEIPADLTEALSANTAAAQHFKDFPPGAQREYTDWILEAKRADTRAKRLAQAVEWLAEGKRRNWKYENC